MKKPRMLRTKRIETVLAQDEGDGERLHKRLRTRDLIGFGVGIVIGTGIFTLTGIQAKENAGPGIVVSFVIAGVIALLAALCYAELAAAVPTAGSSYTYAYATIGEIFAWIIAWDLVLEFALGSAVVSRSWSGYLQELFGLPDTFFGEKSVVNLGAVAIVAVLTVVAALGIKESKWVTNALVITKVAISLFVIVAGLFFVKASNLTPFFPPGQPSTAATAWHKQPLWQAVTGAQPVAYGVGGLLIAAAVVFFAYSGFEAVANLGEETENAGRDMPRGLIGTLVVCALLYMAVSFVLTGMVKYTDISEGAPISNAFTQVGLGWASVLVGVAAITGLASVILVELVALGRIGYALSRDGLLPASLGRLHPKYKTPVRMTIAIAILISLLAAFVPLKALAEMVSIGTLFAFVVVAIAVAALRRTRPDMKRPFKTPLVPVVPIITAVACVALMASLELGTWLRFLVWLAVGMLIYFGWGRRNARLHRHPEESNEGHPAT